MGLKEDFLRKAIEKHSNRYDYSLITYSNAHKKVSIICKDHGVFQQTPNHHINSKQGCPKCAMDQRAITRRKTQNFFLEKAQKVHGSKYDYSKSVYVGCNKKLKIICPIHGEFYQTPSNHYKYGCSQCGFDRLRIAQTSCTRDFVQKATSNHITNYDYSKVKYTHSQKKVEIVCPKHGSFLQSPANHLKGTDCPYCHNENLALTQETFIKKCLIIHKNKYSYSKTILNKLSDPIIVTCPIHGDYKVKAGDHLKGRNCRMCVGTKLTHYEFIKKAKEKHKYFYLYTKTLYIKSNKKVIITCPIHGDFKQQPNNHLMGQGCPACKNSIGERRVSDYLILKSIPFKTEFKPQTCINPISKRKLSFDFAIYNTKEKLICFIEYDGPQHFKAVEYFGGKENFLKAQKRDKVKNEYCELNNIPLLRISFKDFNSIEKLIKNFLLSHVEKMEE